MRAVGYLLLLLLALYLLLIKPYMTVRNIQIQLEGVRLSFEKGLSFERLLVYLPFKQTTLHIFVSEASIRPWDLKAGEFNLIEVSTAPPSDKPFDYDFGPLIELASKLNLKVGHTYISTNYVPYGESLTLFIPKTELRAGKVFSNGWTQAYWMHYKNIHHLEVFLEKARTEGKRFILEQAQVRSSLYDFSLRGVWEGKKGVFEADGYIEPIKKESFSLARVNIRLLGSLDYTHIGASFSGFAESLDIKDRREFKSLKLSGEYLWKWREKSQLKAVLTDGFTTTEVNYSLKDGVLRAAFRAFPVDQRLLGIDKRLLTIVNGQLDLDLEKKLLNLQAHSPMAQVEDHKLADVSLRVELNYEGVPGGNLELSVAEPFLLSVKGGFYARDFTGSVELLGYRLRHEDASATISYSGSLKLQQGQALSYGRGRIENLFLKGIELGSASYDLFLEGDSYKINLMGRGYSLSGDGSLKDRTFSGSLKFEGMNLSYAGVGLESLKGNVEVKLGENKAWGSGRLEGKVFKDKISSWIALYFDIEKRGEQLKGPFRGELKEARILQLSYPRGSFEGKVEGEKVSFSFELQDGPMGRGYYDYKNASYSLEGSLRYARGDLSVASKYLLNGRGMDFNLELMGEGKYKSISFPLNVSVYRKEGRLEALMKGFTLKEGLVSLRVPELKLYGGMESGSIDVAPLTMSIGQEVFSKVEFQKGEYKGKALSLKGSMYGALEGLLELSYDEGLRLSSKGVMDLGRFSSVVRSRVFADMEGKVFYKLIYTEALNLKATSDKITFRSRYLAVPLFGALELSFKDNRLSGSVKLIGNQKASILANLAGNDKLAELRFEVSQLPFLYRNETLRTNLFISGKGTLSSDYKNLNIRGEFYTSGVVNLQKVKKRTGENPEEYKRINLDLSVASSEPLRVNLPEGFVYTDISAKVKGTLYEPDYVLKAYLKGGSLTYFEREFYVRRGELTFTGKDNQMDLTIIAPTPDYSIIIDLKGNPQYPKAVIRSEPPRDTREVLTTLVLGGAETEGLIPVGGALISQIPQISQLIKGAKGMTGLDVKVQVSPSVSPTGEVGLSATISKDITQRITVEHRQSTLKNPKETYTGGDVRLTPSTSIGGRYYSDRSHEVRIRLRKKFDF